MQDIGKRNNIQAVVLDRIQFIDFVAFKHKVERIKIEHVTRDDVWREIASKAKCHFQSLTSRAPPDHQNP